jgi:hypothetical protein
MEQEQEPLASKHSTATPLFRFGQSDSSGGSQQSTTRHILSPVWGALDLPIQITPSPMHAP